MKNKGTVVVMSLLMVMSVLLLMYAVIVLIPQVDQGLVEIKLNLILWVYTVSQGGAVILLVAMTGALGSLIHLVTSFVKYVGTGQFERQWVVWYLLRPFIGMLIALVFYFAFRGGMIKPQAATTDLNLYGVLTISSLAGMFSKQATEKLNEIFNIVFSVKEKQ